MKSRTEGSTGRIYSTEIYSARNDGAQSTTKPEHITRTTARHHRLRRGWRLMGWQSLGLGVVHLLAPRAVQRAGGIADSSAVRGILRLIGARELLSGLGLLGSRRPQRFVWMRVAGDAMDLAALSLALARRDGMHRRRLSAATGALAAMAAIDVGAAIGGSIASRRLEVTATTTIRRPRPEVYGFWRNLENLPRFMIHLDDVRVLDSRRSYWRATAPFGRTVSWEAELTEDVPDTRIAWRSIGRAAVPNHGTVTFTTAPDPGSTEVRVRLIYQPPGGRLGAAVAKFLGEDAHQQVDDDLRRLKQVLETGEVVRSDGALLGKHARHEYPQRPAVPARDSELVQVVAG